jgi:hypothetical protein
MREALKGAKRPKLLRGDPVTAALRLAAPFKPLRERYSAPGSSFAPRRLPCNLNNPTLEGWPGLLRSPGHAVRVETTNDDVTMTATDGRSGPIALTRSGSR